MSTDLGAKRLELLKEAAPKARRVAVLLNPANSSHALRLRETQVAAARLHVDLHAVEARRSSEVERALSTTANWRPDALLIMEDPLFVPAHLVEIAAFAAKQRWPTMTGLRSFTDADGLMSFGASFPEMFRGAAAIVVKILNGAKPADLPIEQPAKFELVVNLRTARTLGLTIPPSVLARADEIIQ